MRCRMVCEYTRYCPMPSSGYLPWSFPPLLPCSLPSSLNPSSARFLPPAVHVHASSLPRSFPSPTLPPSPLPSSTDALCLPSIIASYLLSLALSFPLSLPCSLLSHHLLAPSLLPPSLPPPSLPPPPSLLPSLPPSLIRPSIPPSLRPSSCAVPPSPHPSLLPPSHLPLPQALLVSESPTFANV